MLQGKVMKSIVSLNKQMLRSFLLALVCLLLSFNESRASHIYGADLFYTHNSGNTYTITLVVYGDCGGSAFPSFPTSSATVQIFKGSSTTPQTLTLLLQNPTSGVEVTPVCPSQLNNTNCNNGSLPGVKKFVYSRQVTLNGTSTNWRFRFTGALSSSSAGRSNSITNITTGVNGSIMNLEATLNNTNGPNSSPTYTTIPTPFFCINKSASYNPGTVDPNGDSLSYSLVPGLEQIGTVTYVTGYSATAPLASATGTFSYNTQTGQLNFTPNLVQRSLVVNRVNEYKNGVLVGSSMREMTFVVLNNCSNNPPGGKITNNNAGNLDTNGTDIQICKSAGTLTFSINPTDLDNDTINVSYSGLPSGATLSISNNGTTAPTSTFSWNLSSVTPGTYNFFITYVDNGCPLSSKQTLAYTIKVLPVPDVAINITSDASCVKKAVFTMTPSVAPSPWKLEILQGTSTIHTFNSVTASQTDSLSPGTYIVRVTNADTCFKDIPLIIDPPPTLGINLDVTPLDCHDDSNAVVVVKGVGGLMPYKYAKGSGAFTNVDTFKNIWAGYYTFKVKDSNECVKDTVIQIVNPTAVSADVTIQEPPCNFFNSGVITIAGKNGVAPYTYSFSGGTFSSTNTFSGLFSGSYNVQVKDDKSCLLDTVVVLPDSVRVQANAILTHILCNSDSTGEITLNAYGATAPYRYQMVTGGGSLTPINTFNNLQAQTYSFHIEDTNKCYLDTNLTLNEPAALTSNSNITDVLCNGDATGTITLNAGGGVSPYTYAIATGTYSSNNTFNGLGAGTHVLHVKDNNGCIKDTTINITEPAKLSFSNLQITNPKCYNALSGEVITTGTGGVSPYQYAIGTTGSFSPINTFGGLGAGVDTFYVRDTNNCVADTMVTLTQPDRIVPAVAIKQSTCDPLDDGVITMSATGGIPTYTYALGFGSYTSNPTFSPLAAGSYLLHVRDQNNCILDTTVNVADSIIIQANFSVTDAKCFDSSDGIISIVPGGGVNPYSYSLGGGPYGPTPAFGGLNAGNYTVKVKDDLGCIQDTLLVIDEPTRIIPNVSITDPSCYNYSDGTVVVGATGGTPAYVYTIDNRPFNGLGTIGNVDAGLHVVRVKDINNCILDTTITVTQPPGIFFDLDITNLRCFGDSSGMVIIDGSGGTPPYTYAYNQLAFATSDTLKGISAGNNTIKMKDDQGCIIDTQIVFTEPAQLLVVNPIITNPTCEGFYDGSAKVYGNGGVTPYKYFINGKDNGNNNEFDSLKEGINNVRIVDANGCRYDTTLMLVGHPHIIYEDVLQDAVSCFAGKDGKITLNISGGKTPYRYKIDNGPEQTENFFDSLEAGERIVSVTDDYGCIKDSTIILESPDKIKIETKVTPNDCEGLDNGGRIDVYADGGTPGYEYVWNTEPERTGYALTGVANGTYQVKVIDANGCVDSILATIEYSNCCIVFVPDAFTPNNDGINDIIHVRVKGDFDLEVFAIFNRFGELVFETSDLSQGWNGIHKGAIQDLGTYNYYLKGLCGNTDKREVFKKGTITLVK